MDTKKLKETIKALFKSKNKDVTYVKVEKENTLIDYLKLIIGLAILSIIFISITRDNTPSEGVVFKNISSHYSAIEQSFDDILINKQKSDNKDVELYNNINNGAHNVFVITYNGTLMASEVDYLRKKVDAIILKSNKNDEVIIKMNSGGGVVNGYGLVASQIDRLKKHGLKITTIVDKVAASGGYMAAVVSDKIVAAPFAYVGSIGVVANVLIYEDLLKFLGIESKVYTSGTSKRTVVPTKMPTKEEEAKLKKELEEIHTQFKNHVLKYRPNVNKEESFTGQAFLANDALRLGLVDEINTSDDILLQKYKEGNRIIDVAFQRNMNPISNLTKTISTSLIDTVKTELLNDNVIYQ